MNPHAPLRPDAPSRPVSPARPLCAPRIVHVSADFPDDRVWFKTPAIRSLVDLAGDGFEHTVYSLNRRLPTLPRLAARVLRRPFTHELHLQHGPFAQGRWVEYEAPGRGLWHAAILDSLGTWLAGELAAGPLPDLIVGHKLTVEGLVVRRAAELLGRPYALSIQGDTDTKILAARPDLAASFAAVFHGARCVFPFAPWSLQRIERRLGPRRGATVLLPCPTDLDQPLPPVATGGGLVSVFHLKNARRKNLGGMARALGDLRAGGGKAPLAIVGGGDPADTAAARRLARAAPWIVFEGPLADRALLQRRLNRATALVLPSLRESFGMVFVEALFAGVPIIYPAGTAVDGYFDDCPFAIRVDARDPRSIAAGMARAIAEEPLLKAELARWQHGPDARRFRREAIGEVFSSGLRAAIASGYDPR